MLNDLPSDVRADIEQRLAGGNYSSEADVVRQAMRALKVHDEELAAIQLGIDDMRAGRVRVFEDVEEGIRQEFDFSIER